MGNVDSYVDDVCLFVECGRGEGGGGAYHGGVGGGLRRGDAAPYIGTLGPKYILFGYMDPYTFNPYRALILTLNGTLFGHMDP